MKWKLPLSTRRVRDLVKGTPSQRVRSEKRTIYKLEYGRSTFSTPVRRHKVQVLPLEDHGATLLFLENTVEY